MSSPAKPAKVLYFINDMVPTDAERAEAAKIGPGAMFRNAQFAHDVTTSAQVEKCDYVAGAVPPNYAAAYPAWAPGAKPAEAAFPPEGWTAHPTSPGYFFKDQEVLTEEQLRAKFN